MMRSSLRLRLLVGAAVAIFAALALAWLGISLLFHQHVERREAAALERLAEQVIAGLRLDASGKPLVDAQINDARLQAMAGGLYWQAVAPGGSAQSPSLWDQSLPGAPASATGWSTANVAGPFEKRLTMVGREIRLNQGGPAVIVRAAQDDSEMRGALREFDRELALSLGLLWLVLSLAAYVQVSLGLRPLDRLRQELDRLRRSPAARLTDSHPREIAPLTGAINALAEAREGDLGRARRRAADLAHSLKTPLAVLCAQSRRAREAGALTAADGLDRAIEAMGAALETELARARAAAARGSAGESAPLGIAEGLVAVIERTESGERIVFTVAIDPALRIPVESPDLAEMLGALIENATHHARRQVRITGARDGAALMLSVEDDGPGMEPAAAAAAMQRGTRLDEAGSGHGLGLAIVRDLAEATEADFALGRSDLGGLAAHLRWNDHSPKLR